MELSPPSEELITALGTWYVLLIAVVVCLGMLGLAVSVIVKDIMKVWRSK